MTEKCEKHNVPYVHSTWGVICPECRLENATRNIPITEEVKINYTNRFLEYNGADSAQYKIIDYIKKHIYNNSNCVELSCSPEICLVIESDDDFHTILDVSFYDTPENNAIIGEHWGFNIRRNIKTDNTIEVLDENGEVIKIIKFVKMTDAEHLDRLADKRNEVLNKLEDTYKDMFGESYDPF